MILAQERVPVPMAVPWQGPTHHAITLGLERGVGSYIALLLQYSSFLR
jgi:hypothetical protein